MANPLPGIAEGWRRNVEAAQRLGTAATAAPETSYSPLCKHGRRLEFTGCAECEIEYDLFDRPNEDEAARDRAAGRDETTIADEERNGKEE